MKMMKSCLLVMAMLVAGGLGGCSMMSSKSADVVDSVRASLSQNGLRNITVSQDREKGVVTLTGNVEADSDKARAETLAKALVGSQVVSNQIAVVPVGSESAAMTMNADLDKGIEHNLNAALTREKLNERVKFNVKNHVVTLSGVVDSQKMRSHAEETAAAVQNVQQVVNELQVKEQKASSSN